VESSLLRAADVVVKVGGGVLADVAGFDAVLATLGEAARSCRLVVVPGGGPFADAVRAVDRQLGLSETAAHWMAIAAMDQYAHVIAERLDRTSLIESPREIGAAIAGGRVPILRPSRWLRETDPLPHSWDVTSDSIAAWIAGQLGARQLILVKPPGVDRSERAVDAYFAHALPRDVDLTIVPADRISELRSAVALRRSG
jgi:5-(aminomethyl)-3-furanmethanol phosphate kinase